MKLRIYTFYLSVKVHQRALINSPKIKILWLLLCITVFSACNQPFSFDEKIVREAKENGISANEGFVRSLLFVNGWLAKADSASGLIPSNLFSKTDIWEPHNSAADNYSFMVLTAYLLDKNLYEEEMLDILNNEKKITSRVKSLPDTWSFSKRAFISPEPLPGTIIFGTSEYIKDGLLPLTEFIGHSPWNVRMMEMLDDLLEYMEEAGSLESVYPERMASVEEVNGEMLQTLSRVYWMTGSQKYLEKAIEIGDYYLLGERDLSQIEYLRLRDHGCEIISGLSELYVTLHFVDKKKKEQYRPAMYKLLDRVLEVGRNEDGLFYDAVNTKTGEIMDKGIADTWGYTLNAFYSVWLIDKKEEYRHAVIKVFEKLNEKYRNYPWEGTSHDGYADALESGINLYNREPDPNLKNWIDSEIKVMFDMQQKSGIIIGTHADGNFARTAIMYSLWKTQGANIQPWRSDVILGAEKKDEEIFFTLTAENGWKGKLFFDTHRHKAILNLPIDYPRINQFPEWFTINKNEEYSIVSSQKELTGEYLGKALLKGLSIELEEGELLVIKVKGKNN
jgi:hypothetical protein